MPLGHALDQRRLETVGPHPFRYANLNQMETYKSPQSDVYLCISTPIGTQELSSSAGTPARAPTAAAAAGAGRFAKWKLNLAVLWKFLGLGETRSY